MTTENKNIENNEEVKNEVAETQKQEVAVQNQSYIANILEEIKHGFLEANDGLDFDFVHMGEWLSLNSKGDFIEKDNEDENFGDSIDVVIGLGEKRYSLWGHDDTPEEGVLIVAERDQQDAYEAFDQYLGMNPEAAERYNYDDIKLRYMALVVPVNSLKDGEFPQIYNVSLSPTDTIVFGRWAMSVYQGKGLAKQVGVKRGTGVNKIVTRLKSVERQNRNDKSKRWLGIDFEPVGMFNPADYGISE